MPQRCQDCGHYAHPPVRFCRSCTNLESPSFRFEPLARTGRVVSWTVIHEHLVAGFEDAGPLTHLLVELDAQAHLYFSASLVGPTEGLAIGAPVEVVFDEVAPGASLPYLQLRR
jgi:uncharacterized OB-fold protein